MGSTCERYFLTRRPIQIFAENKKKRNEIGDLSLCNNKEKGKNPKKLGQQAAFAPSSLLHGQGRVVNFNLRYDTTICYHSFQYHIVSFLRFLFLHEIIFIDSSLILLFSLNTTAWFFFLGFLPVYCSLSLSLSSFVIKVTFSSFISSFLIPSPDVDTIFQLPKRCRFGLY